MIFFSIGLPSRFAEWCDQLVGLLVERALGPVRVAGAGTLTEVSMALIESPAPHLVIAARHPTAALVEAVANSGRGFLIALDDPRAALQNIVVQHGVEWIAAIRATASSCAAVLAYTALPQAIVLRASHAGSDPVATAGLIAARLGLDLDPTDVAACVAALPSLPGMAGGEDAVEYWWGTLEAGRREMAAGALTAYVDYFADRGLGALIWRRELFLLGDEPERSADHVVHLAGEVRNLLFGPFIALPRGNWVCTVTFAVSQEASGMNFGFEVVAGQRCIQLAYAVVIPDDQGFCRASLEFATDSATEQPIAMRLSNLQAASAGRLILDEVSLTPQTVSRTPIPAELLTALGP
jgi:hypothetical protein